MKDPLKRLVIAASGKFVDNRRCRDIKKWVENSGGQWSTCINGKVTHLIADESDWKNESLSVKEAKARANIHIVTFDWLNDSLTNHYPYAPKKYLWTNVEKKAAKSVRKKKEKEEKSEEVKNFKKGAAAAKRDLQSGTSENEDSPADETMGEDRGKGRGRSRGGGRGRSKARGTGVGRSRGTDKAGQNSNAPTETQTEPTSNEKSPSSESRLKASSPSPTRSSPPTSPMLARPLESSVQKLKAFRAATAARRAVELTQKIRSNLLSSASPTDRYHVYVDPTGFPHNTSLTRVNVHANTSELIELSIYESDFEATKFYAVHVAYNGPDGAEEKKILVNPGANFDKAFQMFRAAFKRVCMIPWEARFIGEAACRPYFTDVEMHNRRRMEMERFGEIFTIQDSNGAWVDSQRPCLNDDDDDDGDEDEEGGSDGKRKRGGNAQRKGKKRKKNTDSSDDEGEREAKKLSFEDLEACRVKPFKYMPPPKGKPKGLLPTFAGDIGGDDMQPDQEFLTMPNL